MTDQNSDRSTKTGKSSGGGSQRRIAGRCWNCDRPGHMATECRAPKSGASGKTQNGGSSRSPRTNQVQTSTKGGETPTPPVTGTTAQPSDATETTHPNVPLQYLLPDSDEEGVARVTEIRVKDQGSRPQLVRVEVGGVPLDGVVDTGADITLIGEEAFKRIATVAKLRRQDFKRPDKTPRTYDQKTFRIDGRFDVDITTHYEDPCVRQDGRQRTAFTLRRTL